MSETIHSEQPPEQLNEQVEQFIAAFSNLRKVIGPSFKRAHQHGFSATQFMVLGLIERASQVADEGPCTISALAGHLGVDPATVVRTVDSLEKRGLVERRRDKLDRRQVFVEFTNAGRAARAEALQQFLERVRAIFLAMSAEGRASLLSGLSEFVAVGLDVQEAGGGQERNREKRAPYSQHAPSFSPGDQNV